MNFNLHNDDTTLTEISLTALHVLIASINEEISLFRKTPPKSPKNSSTTFYIFRRSLPSFSFILIFSKMAYVMCAEFQSQQTLYWRCHWCSCHSNMIWRSGLTNTLNGATVHQFREVVRMSRRSQNSARQFSCQITINAWFLLFVNSVSRFERWNKTWAFQRLASHHFKAR